MFENIKSTYDNAFSNTSSTWNSLSSPAYTPFNRQKLPFVFEVLDNREVVDEFILPLNPETYSLTHTTRTALTLTQAGAFEDNIGMGLPTITISGTFGHNGTLPNGIMSPAGNGRNTNTDGLSGIGHMNDLETVFMAFYEAFGTYRKDGQTQVSNPHTAENPKELRFYNYSNWDYYVVQIKKFELRRSVQRRHIMQYDIQMQALKWIEPKKDESAYYPVLAAPTEPTWVDILLALPQLADDLKNDLQTIAHNTNRLINGVTDYILGIKSAITTPFSMVTSIIAGIDAALGKFESFADIPAEIFAELRNTKRELYALIGHEEKFSESTVTPATETTVDPANGLTEVSAEESLFEVILEAKKTAGIETVSSSDTIQSIAKSKGVTWTEIALLNSLEHPYIVRDMADAYSPVLIFGTLSYDTPPETKTIVISFTGALPGNFILFRTPDGITAAEIEAVTSDTVTLTEPTIEYLVAGTELTLHADRRPVLLPGDKVLIPQKNSAGSNGIHADASESNITTANFDVKMYGADEALDDNGGMLGIAGDITVLTGQQNLAMQLQHRLMTMKGELSELGHPEYGSNLPKLVGKLNSAVNRERALLEARLCILSDPRVDRIDNERMMADNTMIYLQANIYPIGQSSALQLTVPMTM